jgi:hypothetical protein
MHDMAGKQLAPERTPVAGHGKNRSWARAKGYGFCRDEKVLQLVYVLATSMLTLNCSPFPTSQEPGIQQLGAALQLFRHLGSFQG